MDHFSTSSESVEVIRPQIKMENNCCVQQLVDSDESCNSGANSASNLQVVEVPVPGPIIQFRMLPNVSIKEEAPEERQNENEDFILPVVNENYNNVEREKHFFPTSHLPELRNMHRTSNIIENADTRMEEVTFIEDYVGRSSVVADPFLPFRRQDTNGRFLEETKLFTSKTLIECFKIVERALSFPVKQQFEKYYNDSIDFDSSYAKGELWQIYKEVRAFVENETNIPFKNFNVKIQEEKHFEQNNSLSDNDAVVASCDSGVLIENDLPEYCSGKNNVLGGKTAGINCKAGKRATQKTAKAELLKKAKSKKSKINCSINKRMAILNTKGVPYVIIARQFGLTLQEVTSIKKSETYFRKKYSELQNSALKQIQLPSKARRKKKTSTSGQEIAPNGSSQEVKKVIGITTIREILLWRGIDTPDYVANLFGISPSIIKRIWSSKVDPSKMRIVSSKSVSEITRIRKTSQIKTEPSCPVENKEKNESTKQKEDLENDCASQEEKPDCASQEEKQPLSANNSPEGEHQLNHRHFISKETKMSVMAWRGLETTANVAREFGISIMTVKRIWSSAKLRRKFASVKAARHRKTKNKTANLTPKPETMFPKSSQEELSSGGLNGAKLGSWDQNHSLRSEVLTKTVSLETKMEIVTRNDVSKTVALEMGLPIKMIYSIRRNSEFYKNKFLSFLEEKNVYLDNIIDILGRPNEHAFKLALEYEIDEKIIEFIRKCEFFIRKKYALTMCGGNGERRNGMADDATPSPPGSGVKNAEPSAALQEVAAAPGTHDVKATQKPANAASEKKSKRRISKIACSISKKIAILNMKGEPYADIARKFGLTLQDVSSIMKSETYYRKRYSSFQTSSLQQCSAKPKRKKKIPNSEEKVALKGSSQVVKKVVGVTTVREILLWRGIDTPDYVANLFGISPTAVKRIWSSKLEPSKMIIVSWKPSDNNEQNKSTSQKENSEEETCLEDNSEEEMPQKEDSANEETCRKEDSADRDLSQEENAYQEETKPSSGTVSLEVQHSHLTARRCISTDTKMDIMAWRGLETAANVAREFDINIVAVKKIWKSAKLRRKLASIKALRQKNAKKKPAKDPPSPDFLGFESFQEEPSSGALSDATLDAKDQNHSLCSEALTKNLSLETKVEIVTRNDVSKILALEFRLPIKTIINFKKNSGYYMNKFLHLLEDKNVFMENIIDILGRPCEPSLKLAQEYEVDEKIIDLIKKSEFFFRRQHALTLQGEAKEDDQALDKIETSCSRAPDNAERSTGGRTSIPSLEKKLSIFALKGTSSAEDVAKEFGLSVLSVNTIWNSLYLEWKTQAMKNGQVQVVKTRPKYTSSSNAHVIDYTEGEESKNLRLEASYGVAKVKNERCVENEIVVLSSSEAEGEADEKSFAHGRQS